MSAIVSLPDFPLSTIFLSYVGVVAAIVAAVLLRYLPTGRGADRRNIGFIAIWLCYAGVMGYSGIVGDPTLMPPGIFLLLTPIIAFVAIVLGAFAGRRQPRNHHPARRDFRAAVLPCRCRTDAIVAA